MSSKHDLVGRDPRPDRPTLAGNGARGDGRERHERRAKDPRRHCAGLRACPPHHYEHSDGDRHHDDTGRRSAWDRAAGVDDASHRNTASDKHAGFGHPHDHDIQHRDCADGCHPGRSGERLNDCRGSAQEQLPCDASVHGRARVGDLRGALGARLYRVGAWPMAGARTTLDGLADALSARGVLPRFGHLGRVLGLGSNRSLKRG